MLERWPSWRLPSVRLGVKDRSYDSIEGATAEIPSKQPQARWPVPGIPGCQGSAGKGTAHLSHRNLSLKSVEPY
eukprot:5149597-Pyramimonas_sp.AAC.1